MTSPVPTHHRPPRAEPLQPDRPGRQDSTEGEEPSEEERARESFHRSAQEQLERSKGAVENVREGYK
jgi:hypothetical protein